MPRSRSPLHLLRPCGRLRRIKGGPEPPEDHRWTSAQGTGNLSDSVSLSTKAQYTFSFCCCKMVATHTLPIRNFRGRGRLWVSVSFAVCARKTHLPRITAIYGLFYLLSPPTVAFRSYIQESRRTNPASPNPACPRGEAPQGTTGPPLERTDDRLDL